jgi:hypothetical protein
MFKQAYMGYAFVCHNLGTSNAYDVQGKWKFLAIPYKRELASRVSVCTSKLITTMLYTLLHSSFNIPSQAHQYSEYL